MCRSYNWDKGNSPEDNIARRLHLYNDGGNLVMSIYVDIDVPEEHHDAIRQLARNIEELYNREFT